MDTKKERENIDAAFGDLQGMIDNPSKSETYDDIQGTIANQMARFTYGLTDSDEPVEQLKLVTALGMDLWKTCGKKVCEDTNMTLTNIIRQQNVQLAGQFQQIALNSNNNDICIYLYLALPTIGNDLSRESLKKLCYDTIDKIAEAYTRVPFSNYKSINTEQVKSLYEEYLQTFKS